MEEGGRERRNSDSNEACSGPKRFPKQLATNTAKLAMLDV